MATKTKKTKTKTKWPKPHRLTRQERKESFIQYLKETLIPDLRDMGMEYTADDFETAIDYMEN
jgi:hypothetical protein